MAEAVLVEIDATSRTSYWKDLWRYRELFYFFAWRDIRVKYKQTLLGFAWAILQPTVMMAIFTLFFGRALKVDSQGVPYPVFALSGLVIWNLFSTGLTNTSTSMVTNAPIIKKVFFPRLVIPVSAVMVAVFDTLMTFVPLAVVLIWYGQPVSAMAVVYWPAALILACFATLGLGTWLGALNVKYRDFRYVIPFLVQLMFFMTPVIYPVSFISNPLIQKCLAASPLFLAMELFRFPITGELASVDLLALSFVSCLLFLTIGVSYFRSTERFFADLA